jgi:serine/threonine-protein kinase
VVHRDIKPENLLLAAGGARVADFGIARAIAAAGGDNLTGTGAAVGTPAYMSPEQAAGSGDLDGRSDIYSLGCVLYEMLAGKPPFTGPNVQAVIAMRWSDAAPRISLVREVPPAVEQALGAALATLPEDRFATAAQFATALKGTDTTPLPFRTRISGGDMPTRRLPRPTEPKPRRVRLVLGSLGLAALAATSVLVLDWRSTPPASSRGLVAPAVTRLAVLPFENIGDSTDAYFADGVADAVRGKLTALAGLEVIARTSSMAYRQTNKSPEQVARELGVRYLLTGTVRWATRDRTRRVLVSPELVEVRETGAPASKWQQPFDAALTDVFQVQADIASRVAQALNVALGSQEQQQLAQRPTADLAAYDAFLKGEAASQAMAAWDAPSLQRAVAFYEQAVARDSTFGLAWARIAQASGLLYGSITTPTVDKAAWSALVKAERFAPNAPETYQAHAWYQGVVRRDPVRALAAAEAGLARTPDHSELMAVAAETEGRLGRYEAAVERLMQAQTLDPRSVLVSNHLGISLTYMRRWTEARRALEHALLLAPTNVRAIQDLVITYLGEGDLAGAQRVLAEAPPEVNRTQLAAYLASGGGWVLDQTWQQQILALPLSAFDDDRGAWALTRAEYYNLRGDRAMTLVYADSARIAYEAQIRATPNRSALHSLRGLALAYLGRKTEAIAAGERGAALLPITRDALRGPDHQLQLAQIYLLVGENEKALDRLESLVKVPYSLLSPGWLRIDPTYAPLRGNPRFERLSAGKI